MLSRSSLYLYGCGRPASLGLALKRSLATWPDQQLYLGTVSTFVGSSKAIAVGLYAGAFALNPSGSIILRSEIQDRRVISIGQLSIRTTSKE